TRPSRDEVAPPVGRLQCSLTSALGFHSHTVKHTTLVTFACVLVALAGHGAASAAGSFYVDSLNGNDSNPGTQTAPWQSLTRANKQLLAPGDSLLLQRGRLWR